MSYPFPAELQQLVDRELSTGSYANEDEVLLEAMRALRERAEAFQQWRAEIQSRIESLDRGEGIVLEDEKALREFADDIQRQGRQCYEEANKRVP